MMTSGKKVNRDPQSECQLLDISVNISLNQGGFY